jgi:RNA polymerase sigma factor (sigma-70 family)
MNGLPIARALPVAMSVSAADRLSGLFDAHYECLYRLARRLAHGPDEALDLVQETFLRAARFVTSIPVGVPDEEAWLVRILINIRRDQWRQAKVRHQHQIKIRGDVGGAGPEAEVVARATIWRALDQLTPRRRAIVILHELEEQTVAAIAKILGIAAVTVRWHLAMARRDLTRLLQAKIGDRK